MFPPALTSVLSGASRYQLKSWRSTGLLIPEVSRSPVLYSFRDVIALRTVMRLRTESSLQKVRTAFANMPEFDLTKHPAEYKFGTDGKTIWVIDDEGRGMDLVKNPGQYEIFTLADIFEPFTTKNGRDVVDFRRPKPYLRVDGERMGGWPTIKDTRVPYDTVASLIDDDLTPADVSYYYPTVPIAAVRDAVEFAELVKAAGRRAS